MNALASSMGFIILACVSESRDRWDAKCNQCKRFADYDPWERLKLVVLGLWDWGFLDPYYPRWGVCSLFVAAFV